MLLFLLSQGLSIALGVHNTCDTYLKTLQDETAALAVANSNTKLKRKDSRKTDDDKKKKMKSKSSQGVDKLKKANINGMAKMSSFFKKS